MIQASDDYILAAISNTRHVSVKIRFPYFEMDKLINMKYGAEFEPHIGGIEYRYLDVECESRGDILTGDEAILYIGFYIGEIIEWLEISKFYVSNIKNIRNSETMKLSMLGYSNKLIEKVLPELEIKQNILLQDYLYSILPDAETDSNINPRLRYSFYSAENARNVFDDIAKAINSIITMRDKTPYFKSISEIYPSVYFESATIKRIEYGEDSLQSFNAVDLVISNIYKSESKEIARIEIDDLNEPVYDIIFENPSETLNIKVTSENPINYIEPSVSPKRLKMNISGSKSATVSVIGNEYLAARNTSGNEADDSVFRYENLYIQNSRQANNINTKFLTGERVSCSYSGNPVIEVGDGIILPDVGNFIIYSVELEYSGGLRGRLGGVLVE